MQTDELVVKTDTTRMQVATHKDQTELLLQEALQTIGQLQMVPTLIDQTELQMTLVVIHELMYLIEVPVARLKQEAKQAIATLHQEHERMKAPQLKTEQATLDQEESKTAVTVLVAMNVIQWEREVKIEPFHKTELKIVLLIETLTQLLPHVTIAEVMHPNVQKTREAIQAEARIEDLSRTTKLLKTRSSSRVFFLKEFLIYLKSVNLNTFINIFHEHFTQRPP